MGVFRGRGRSWWQVWVTALPSRVTVFTPKPYGLESLEVISQGPAPQSLHPTLHPAPRSSTPTLHPAPRSLHPTLHPAPGCPLPTLHPAPWFPTPTLHLAPWSPLPTVPGMLTTKALVAAPLTPSGGVQTLARRQPRGVTDCAALQWPRPRSVLPVCMSPLAGYQRHSRVPCPLVWPREHRVALLPQVVGATRVPWRREERLQRRR